MRQKLSLAFLVFMVSGCGHTIDVLTNYQKGFDFQSLRTFKLADTDPQTLFPVGAKDPVGVDARIKKAVELELQDKGLKLSDSPDVIVGYRIHAEEHVAAMSQTGSNEWNPDRDVSNYRKGALILDLVDTKTNEVVWRGAAMTDFETGKGAALVEPAVTQIFLDFPPGK